MLLQNAGAVHPSVTHHKTEVSKEHTFFSWHYPNRKMFAQGRVTNRPLQQPRYLPQIALEFILAFPATPPAADVSLPLRGHFSPSR